MRDLQELADTLGIAKDYIDSSGKYKVIDKECRALALKTLGFNIDNEQQLEQQIKEYIQDPYLNMLPYVTVIRDGDKNFIYIATPQLDDFLNDEIEFHYRFELENGKQIIDSMPLYELEIAYYKDIYGQEYDVRRFFVPTTIDYGYHKFSCFIKAHNKKIVSRVMSYIRTPKICYMPDKILAGKKVWGVSTQLYSLRSRNNWGIGDFSDLKQLLKYVAKSGGNFVGLNPLHASYPCSPDPDMVSPYSPSSRKWLNIIYIDVSEVKELHDSKKALDFIKSEDVVNEICRLRSLEYVDYIGVRKLKLTALRHIYDDVIVKGKNRRRQKEFHQFLKQGSTSLIRLAIFDCLQNYHFEAGIEAYNAAYFRDEFKDINSPAVLDFYHKHKVEIEFFCYLQLIAQEQLQRAHKEALDDKMIIGIYRDLAVGVSFGSCDVWSDDAHIYAQDGSSIGAPPDDLGPKGQSWGLCPINPINAYKNAYKEIIALYQSNMKSCGALRIDHAAGLYRYWVVPPHKEATEGVYIKNNLHDILGIIALESVRNNCLVIAEDLGTIPQELRVALKESGCFSYKLFFGERAADGGYIAPYDYDIQAMSALTTHDMATLKSWWACADLDLGVDLGVYTAIQAFALKADRENAKQRILDSLHGLHSVDDKVSRNAADCKLTEDLVVGMQVHMCRGSCLLYSTQLEDWIGVEKPVNVPGTFKEYPNWKRKLTRDLEDIFSDEKVKNLTTKMTEARG